jgi:hypothetical protein
MSGIAIILAAISLVLVTKKALRVRATILAAIALILALNAVYEDSRKTDLRHPPHAITAI